MSVPIQLQLLPRRPMKPARKRALLFWLVACAVAMGSAALMVLYVP